MPAHIVILLAMPKSRHQSAAAGCAHFPVVKTGLFHKRTRLPASHPRGSDRHPVNATTLDRSVAPHLFEASSSEHLASARYVLEIGKFMSIGMVLWLAGILNKRRAR